MKFRTSYTVLTLLCISILFLLADASYAQCSMCQKIATDGANSKMVAASLNHGILYLLALPYCMLAFIFRKQIIGFMRGFLAKK
jgi:membrane glycosyltransferase